MLYPILIAPDHRLMRSAAEDTSLDEFLTYLEGVKDKYLTVLARKSPRASHWSVFLI
jgi:hypothetical protein